MAVIVKYVVVRNGDEKMTFATRKEADAYDKMLDIADNMYDFFEEEALPLDEQQKESVSMFLARNKETVLKIMKGIKVPIKSDEKKLVEKKPIEKKPVEKKPVEKKPVERKPVERKPVGKKQIEKKPVLKTPRKK